MKKNNIITSSVIVMILLLFSVFIYMFAYHGINESFFDATRQHTTDLMETIRNQGVQLVDEKLKTLKTNLEADVAREQERILQASDEEIYELLQAWKLPEDGIGYTYCTQGKNCLPTLASSYTDTKQDINTVLQEGKTLVLDPYFDAQQIYTLAIATPVFQGDEAIAAIVIRLDGFCISRWIQTIQFQTGMGLGYIVSSNGTNIAASREQNYDWITSQYNSLQMENPSEEDKSVAALEQQPLLGHTGNGSYQWDGETNYLVYAPLHEAGWGFFVGFYGNTVRSYIQTIASQSTASSIPVGVLFFLFLAMMILYTNYNLYKERKYVKDVLRQKEEIQAKTMKLAISEERFRIALERSKNVIFEYSFQFDEITNFYEAKNIAAIPFQEAKETLIEDCEIRQESMEVLKTCLNAMRAGEAKQECVIKGVRGNGERVWYKAYLSLVADDVAVMARAVGMLEDITQEKSAELDPLTGLYNKKVIEDKITTLLENSDVSQKHMYLIFDIDDFKSVNDTYGHPAGDQVIIGFAHLLKEHFAKHAFVGRIGGDEFCVYFNEAISMKQLKEILVEVHNRVEEGILSGYERIAITYSCGIASAIGKEKSQGELYAEADKALYKAKSNGKNQDIFLS